MQVHNYGGPQLSRQELIPRGKRKLLTAKENYPRQKEKTHGKKKNLAAKRKTSRQKEKDSRQKEKPRGKKKKTHGKKKNLAAKRKRLTAKRKRLTAKRKTSRQKEKDSRQKEKTHGKKKNGFAAKKKGHGGWPSFSKYSVGKKAVKRGVIGLQDSYPMFSLAVLYQSLNRFTCLYVCSQWVCCGGLDLD